MKYVLLLIFISSTIGRRCPGVTFNGRYYDVEILKDGVNRVQQLVLSKHDNTLYFIFEQISEERVRGLGFLNLDTRESGLLGVRNASSITVDNYNKVVYAGGADGVYKVENKDLQFLPIRDNIQSVFYKDVLYYTNRRNEAFTYLNGYIDPVPELQGVAAENLVLDDDHNIFFTQGRSLFRVKLGTRAVNSHESFKVERLSVDTNYKPYVTTDRGVFVYNKYKYVLDKVSDMDNLRGLTFNRNNEPIFAALDTIYKLNYNANRCYE